MSDQGRFFGVFDGHGGVECSRFLRDNIEASLGRIHSRADSLDELSAAFFGSSTKKESVRFEPSLLQ